MDRFTTADTQLLLVTSPDAKLKSWSSDAALLKSLTKVLNASLDFAKVSPDGAGLGMALSKKGLAISGLAATTSGSNNLKVANFAATQVLKSIGLMKIAGMTPTKAVLQISLVTAEKIVSTAGMAEMNKCGVAIASLSATAATGGLTCFATGAFTLGVGCVAGAIAVAAEAFDAYDKCSLP